jgi:hypothetical protein
MMPIFFIKNKKMSLFLTFPFSYRIICERDTLVQKLLIFYAKECGDMTLSITTLSITTLSIMTLSITTLSIMTLGIKTISIMQSIVTLSVIYADCHIQAFYAECHYSECLYAECYYAGCRYSVSWRQKSIQNGQHMSCQRARPRPRQGCY